MLGIVYAIGWLCGIIKDTVQETIDDVRGRQHRKINNRFYISGTKTMDTVTGHQVSGYGDHKYYDFSTGEFFRTSITAQDIKEEEGNKAEARRWGFSTYRISSARLPANVNGIGYKDFNNERIYVSRYIYQTSKIFKYPKYIKGTFLVSINPDNYGRVERHFGGKTLEPLYAEAFKNLYIDVTKDSWNNEDFGWRK